VVSSGRARDVDDDILHGRHQSLIAAITADGVIDADAQDAASKDQADDDPVSVTVSSRSGAADGTASRHARPRRHHRCHRRHPVASQPISTDIERRVDATSASLDSK
jgi:hypothetical protein